jgi:hypothetical protein
MVQAALYKSSAAVWLKQKATGHEYTRSRKDFIGIANENRRFTPQSTGTLTHLELQAPQLDLAKTHPFVKIRLRLAESIMEAMNCQ